MKLKFSLVIVSLVSLLLIASLFASSVIAQDDDNELEDDESAEELLEESDVLEEDEVEVLEEDEIEEELPEVEEEIEEIEESEEVQEIERKAMFTLTRVTIGEGFVVKDDESDAEFFRGMWVVKRFINKTATLGDVDEAEIETKKFGFVVIGVAEEKEKFRIEIKEFSEENVIFDVKDNTGTIVGSMEIKPKRYPRLTLWFGTLTLNSGSYTGSWDVTAVSKTKIIKPEIKKVAAWKVFAVKQRREVKIKEKAQERVFEEEGLGEFARENKGKDLGKLSDAEKRVVINKRERFEKRIEARAAGRARARIEARAELQ